MKLLKIFLKEVLKIEDEIIYEKFSLYNKLLLEWNSKINLISRNSESIEAQVLNSIFFLTKYSFPRNANIIDVGTGGGFPGIPLKILRNDLSITLNDSISKKTIAIKDIVNNLELKETKIICGRAETLSKESSSKNKFDIVIAKSVATLDKLFIWTKLFLKDNGEMIFIKGGDISNELEQLKKKNKDIKFEVVEFVFDDIYKIEDKKIVLIKNN